MHVRTPALPLVALLLGIGSARGAHAQSGHAGHKAPASHDAHAGHSAPASHDAHAGHATTPPREGSAETRPDVLFMQGMIPHHAQALEMAAMVAGRNARREVRLMAERIAVSQQDEIRWMRQWLADHGAEAPGEHAHHGSHSAMAGMATPAQMAELAAATGPAFDRLFFELMVRHHEGALSMAGDLLAAPGGTAEPTVFQFVADLEADQGAEIDRMQTILTQLQPSLTP